MEIIAIRNLNDEGANFIFDKKFKLHGGLELSAWWMSWPKFMDFFNEITDKAKALKK